MGRTVAAIVNAEHFNFALGERIAHQPVRVVLHVVSCGWRAHRS
jgi:hypothetical protein